MTHELDEQKLEAALRLAMGERECGIAHCMKISRSTLSRWKRLPEFRAEMERQAEDIRGYLRHRILATIDCSLSTLCSTMRSGQYDPSKTALEVIRLAANGGLSMPYAEKPAITQGPPQ